MSSSFDAEPWARDLDADRASPRDAVIAGYTLLEQLGQGGFARVFRAQHHQTRRIVALKVLHVNRELDPVRREHHRARFWRETALSATLHHPNIVGLVDRGRMDDGELFAAYEFVPGETLRDVLVQRGALPAQEAGELMGQVLDALACAHSKGVIHRDLKPENIMIMRTGVQPQAMVLDFGIGALAEPLSDTAWTPLTLTNEVVGTPAYAAPEQLRGESPTPKSDIYAWALVFLECLTGQNPITGETLGEIVRCQLDPNEVPLPPGLAGHPLGALLRRALRKNPSHRAGSADVLHAELRRIHLPGLVGALAPARGKRFSNSDVYSRTEDTELRFAHHVLEEERRQLTVLCCSVDIDLNALTAANQERFEQQQRELLGCCRDVLDRFGAWIAGSLAGRIVACFGYPHVSGADARRAAAAAVELRNRLREELAQREEFSAHLAFGVALHTGPVIIGRDGPIDGLTQSVALRLQERTPGGEIYLSSSAARLLEQCPDPALQTEHVPGVVLHDAPVFRVAPARDRAAGSIPPRALLVGRAEERTELARIWEHRTPSQARVVVLVGEAGVGKSSLSRELVAHVRGQGARAHVARCLPEQLNSALQPLLALLREVWSIPASSTEAALTRLEKQSRELGVDPEIAVPILCAWLALPLPAGRAAPKESPHQQKSILYDILQRALVASSPDVLLVIEDLHWADPTTLEFLVYLLGRSDPSQGMVLLTARPEFSPAWSPELTTTLKLAGLESEQVAELALSILGQPLGSRALASIVERTGGVPFFVQELLRMLLEEGHLVLAGGSYEFAQPFDESRIPLTLRATLAERIDRLGEARDTAALAAALGREFSLRVLLAVSQRTPLAVTRDLDVLLRNGVIEEVGSSDGDALYAFRHALIRDVTYDSMLPSSRQHVHARIAEVLLREFPDIARDQPDTLARHFAVGRRFEKAVDYGARAARAALERSANQEAVAHARNVLAWARELPETLRPSVQLRTNAVLTQALMAIRGWADPEVKACVELSTSLLEREPDRDLEIATRWALMTYHYVASNRRELARLAAELVDMAERADDRSLRVAARTFSGLVQHGAGSYPQALAELRLARELYDRELDRDHGPAYGLDSWVWSTATLALALWFRNEPEAAFALAADAVTRARELGHMPSLGIALLYSANLQHYARSKTGVIERCEQLLELDRRYGFPAYAAYASILKAWAEGDAERAQPVLEQLQRMGCTAALSYYASLTGEVLAERGDWSAALAQIDHCVELCQRYEEFYYAPELHRLRATYLDRLGSHERARRAWATAVELADEQGMPWTAALARAAIERTRDNFHTR